LFILVLARERRALAQKRGVQVAARSKTKTKALNTEQVAQIKMILADGRVRTLRELFAGLGADVSKAAVGELPKGTIVFGKPGGKATVKAIAAMVVAAEEHLPKVAASDEVLLARLEGKTGVRRAHTMATITEPLPDKPKKALADALVRRLETERWPPGVGALRTGARQGVIFLLKDVQGLTQGPARPAAATEKPRPNFRSAFESAFDALAPGRLLVKLSDLRAALPEFDRASFDRELNVLRDQDRFVLHTFDGRHGEISPGEEVAAIREGGRTFVYVARKDQGHG
jgi:hypothetical protein